MRPTFSQIYMALALNLAQRSTCLRGTKVGAVITDLHGRHVYAVGYNGNAAGLPNCCDLTGPEAVGKCGCFLPSTPITAYSVERAYRRRYEGDVVRIITTRGEFTATPNHPILALGKGWVAAETLNKGDSLSSAVRDQRVPTSTPNDYHARSIEEIFESCRITGRVVRSAGARHQFHGDGIVHEDVDIVSTDCSLPADDKPDFLQFIGEPSFSRALEVLPSFSGLCSTERSLSGTSLSSYAGRAAYNDVYPRFMEAQFNNVSTHSERPSDAISGFPALVPFDNIGRKNNHPLTFLSAQILGHLAQNPKGTETCLYCSVRDAECGSELQHSLAGLVSPDKVVHVERYRWSGHVYNLQTRSNWYFVGNAGTIAHNCLHAEENAVIHCDVPRDTPKIVYCTHLPCAMCAKRLINLGGVKKVVYLNDYRVRDSLTLFDAVGIQHMKLEDIQMNFNKLSTSTVEANSADVVARRINVLGVDTIETLKDRGRAPAYYNESSFAERLQELGPEAKVLWVVTDARKA